jgi:hypothetical protein
MGGCERAEPWAWAATLVAMSKVGNASARWPRTAAVFGASGGIGRAMAQGLAERGAEVVYTGSRDSRGLSGGAFRPFSFDLTDEASLAGGRCDDARCSARMGDRGERCADVA